MERINKLSGHLSVNQVYNDGNTYQQNIFGKVGVKSPNDVVIVDAARTAVTKARKGAFKDTTPDDLLMGVLKGLMERNPKVKMDDVDEIAVGNVQLAGSYVTPARAAMLRAGFPYTTTMKTLNRQCSSGSQAVADIAAQIATGMIDVGIGGGVESMTHGGNPGDISSLPPMNMNEIFQHNVAKDALTPMGTTSENVAKKYGVTRQEQDEFALLSNKKSLAAIKEGKFKDEIIPLKVVVEDKEGNEKEVVVDTDEGPRNTSLEKLAKLRPAFDPEGKSTAGNSSQTSDGASAVLLMRRSEAEKRGIKVLGVFRGAVVRGVHPAIMGIGPIPAIKACLSQTGVPLKDIDTIELNEAFASQALVVVKELGIDINKVNPNGGAISLGHPLGETGSKLTATLLHELKRKPSTGKPKLGLVTMCIGGGQGHCSLFESE